MSADLTEVNGAVTPADCFAATPTLVRGEAATPEADWGLLDVGLSRPGCFTKSLRLTVHMYTHLSGVPGR